MPIWSLVPVSCNHFILSDRAHVNVIAPVWVVPVRVRTGLMYSGPKKQPVMEWTDHRDILLLREMIASELF